METVQQNGRFTLICLHKCHSNIYSILFDFTSLIYYLKDDILLNKELTNHYEKKTFLPYILKIHHFFIGDSLDVLQYSEEYFT